MLKTVKNRSPGPLKASQAALLYADYEDYEDSEDYESRGPADYEDYEEVGSRSLDSLCQVGLKSLMRFWEVRSDPWLHDGKLD